MVEMLNIMCLVLGKNSVKFCGYPGKNQEGFHFSTCLGPFLVLQNTLYPVKLAPFPPTVHYVKERDIQAEFFNWVFKKHYGRYCFRTEFRSISLLVQYDW